jgi:hypothetical protein
MVVCVLLAAPAARADGVGPDAIYLKNGGIVRGAILEYGLGTQARIQLADGQIRTIQAEDIARVVAGVPGAVPASPAAPPPAAPPPAAAPPTALLHVEGPAYTVIQGRPRDSNIWAFVCQGRCDQPVRLDWEYRIAGSGVRASDVFALSSASGQPIDLRADPASSAGFGLGIAGVIVGVVATYVGGFVYLIGSIGTTTLTTDSYGNTQTVHTADQSAQTAGLAIGIGGLGLAVVGLVSMLNNRATHYTLTDRGAGEARNPDATGRRVEVRTPAAAVVPVVGWTF